MAVQSFSEELIEQISRVLEGAATHSRLNDLFRESEIEEQGGTPKWERIKLALVCRQRRDKCGNNVAHFIEVVLNPVRFVRRNDEFEALRHRLNEVLAFSALHLGENGRLRPTTAAKTLSEAQERAGRLKAELMRRKVHGDVLKHCRVELLQENYFHAVLEATKSVAEKIRQRTGLTGDGDTIVTTAFQLNSPLLALNTLRTETEQSEQKGFANLLRGTFGTFRNPTAHGPKISWPMSEEDALDLLSLVSYLHRRLDEAALVRRS
ncbi:MAG: TIGR02391 family protein [Alphaproteobacteria bacterium]|nr:TIGR02391 family protein [Alphaproteobacteria bacterium]